MIIHVKQQALTWHVGSGHDSSAAGEHDGKHGGKRHDGVGAVVQRVTSCSEKNEEQQQNL